MQNYDINYINLKLRAKIKHFSGEKKEQNILLIHPC